MLRTPHTHTCCREQLFNNILGQDFVIEYHRQTKTEITSRTDLLIICRTYATTLQPVLKRFETLT